MNVRDFLKRVEKGAINTSSGGQLSAQQAKKFIDTVRDMNNLWNGYIEILPVTGPSRNIDIIGLADKAWRGATEGTAPADVVGVSASRRTLTPVEVILPYDITYDFLEENIEQADAEALINAMFAKQFSNDMLNGGINGDTGSGDPFFTPFDGWAKTIKADGSANEYTGAVADASKMLDVIFPELYKTLPAKWRQNKSELVYITSGDSVVTYHEELMTRGTSLGDNVIVNGGNLPFYGIEVVGVPYMPTDFHMLTLKNNLKAGVGRAFTREVQRQPRKRMIEYTITAKVDVDYALSDAIAYADTSDWV